VRRVACVLLALGLVAAGCGGGGGGGDRLTQEEFAQQADAICTEYDKKLDDLGQPQTIEDLANMSVKAQSIANEGLSKLRDLQPPEEIETNVNSWLDKFEQQVDMIDELVEAAQSGDQTKLEQISAQGQDAEAEAQKQARAIGLKECGSSD
jgi:hypothetical protein